MDAGVLGTVRFEDYAVGVYVLGGVLALWLVGCVIMAIRYRGEKRR
jgi:hypothetical protein